MFLRFYPLLLLYFLMIQSVYAQKSSRTISGLVTTENSTPLEGVTISIKGAKKVSGSQADGIYYISATDKDSILVFSHPEYQTQEVKLSGSTEYNVVMHSKQPASAIGADLQILVNWCVAFRTETTQ